MSRAAITGGHRAADDGAGRCAVCKVSVIDYGRGIQHQQGWRARQERVALGLPVRTGVKKPGSRAARVAELEDRIAILTREKDRLQRVANAGKRFDQLEAMLEVIEERLDSIEQAVGPPRSLALVK